LKYFNSLQQYSNVRNVGRFPKHKVGFIFFTDKKIFTVTIECTLPSQQTASASRILHMHTPYIQPLCDNVMSVAICKLGCMQLVFVKPVAKIDDDYHQAELLSSL